MEHQQKTLLLNALHNLIANNVLGLNAYESRFKGFVAELDFLPWMRKNRSNVPLFTGGYFVPTESGKNSLISPVYFTICNSSPDDYLEIYKKIALIPCKSMFFIQWENSVPISEWPQEDIMNIQCPVPVPPLTCYEYSIENSTFNQIDISNLLNTFYDKTPNRNAYKIPEENCKSALSSLLPFEHGDILSLYVQRLIFDGFIGYSKIKGSPSDIDSIAFSIKFNSLVFIEIKEKDRSKRHPQGFGMDIGRINDLLNLEKITGWPAYYLVRQVNDQKARNFIGWKMISMQKFSKNLASSVIQGGTGMGFENGQYPTRICPFNMFKPLE
ncbi:hypothetical protein MXM33_04750 [Acinetobacter vivianii]|uniref:hypothetical protein n=1 Tax=Acinetobacter vivianii TaxID=1776742 RepID=UPI002DBF5D0D|nr:hypothetical protein [Acinetobacter vivianii]MEB6666335.1 hypothetical protein [Acinetobacter vivianii]